MECYYTDPMQGWDHGVWVFDHLVAGRLSDLSPVQLSTEENDVLSALLKFLEKEGQDREGLPGSFVFKIYKFAQVIRKIVNSSDHVVPTVDLLMGMALECSVLSSSGLVSTPQQLQSLATEQVVDHFVGPSERDAKRKRKAEAESRGGPSNKERGGKVKRNAKGEEDAMDQPPNNGFQVVDCFVGPSDCDAKRNRKAEAEVAGVDPQI
eukprot:scaffold237163_cov16-Tisochrysis_lutea.AAC.1